LQLKIKKREYSELTRSVITVGVHWCWRWSRETMMS
jgi:hypothetical protein